MAKRTNNTGQADLRQEAQDVLTEEEFAEYYLFERDVFYEPATPPQVAAIGMSPIADRAVNDAPIESKADVLRFCRSVAPGAYVLVKVMDELEVAPPKEANIVRSNPRLKKPRKAGEA